MNENNSYNLISKIIHWVSALLILGLIFIGFYMDDLEGAQKYKMYDIHKSFGVLLLGLVCVRILWNAIKGKPKTLISYKKWEKILSHISHMFMYLAMIALPLSGWAISSTGGHAVKFFGIKLPALLEKNKELHEIFEELHEFLAIALLFVVGLHILGAFKHHFIDKDITLKRMTAKSLGLVGGIIVLLLAIVAYVPAGGYVAKEVVFDDLYDDDDHKDEHNENKHEDDDH